MAFGIAARIERALPQRLARGPEDADVPDRGLPGSHDAAGGMESLAGGACALGEVGWTFGSVAPYNVTKCDMRRPVCRSDVSVGRLTIKSPNGYARRAQIFGRGGARNAKENPSGPRFSAV